MPIEIRELVIKAVVDRDESPRADTDAGGSDRQLVRDTVEQVMEILERKKER